MHLPVNKLHVFAVITTGVVFTQGSIFCFFFVKCHLDWSIGLGGQPIKHELMNFADVSAGSHILHMQFLRNISIFVWTQKSKNPKV